MVRRIRSTSPRRPRIWKLTDTDGDGVADRRVEWFQGKTLTGCANDLHGPYPGPDGWIYWCKGAFARQTYERPGKPPFSTRASHIFRCRPDGTGIEPVMTGGMDNPVDVVFTPGGERIFTTTFFVHPGGGQRDGLIHAIYGGIYGKVHEPIFEPTHKWTGPEVMPVLLHMGPAAPCGLARYESDAFGTAYRDNLFACYFNLHKVGRHVLDAAGGHLHDPGRRLRHQPRPRLPPDRRPGGRRRQPAHRGHRRLVQALLPDLAAPQARRARGDLSRPPQGRAEAGRPARARRSRWATLTPDGLVKLIDDPRPAVRARAIQTLAGPGRAGPGRSPIGCAHALGPQSGGRLAAATAGRIDCVWTACRIDHPRARALVRDGLDDPDPTVRQAAAHAAGLWRDKEAAPKLIDLLRDGPAPAARASAEALGRIGDTVRRARAARGRRTRRRIASWSTRSPMP